MDQSTKRLRLVIAYDGSNFAGWQLQPTSTFTIQGVLEHALKKVVGCRVPVHGSGRTDSGVHSMGQVAHCDIPLNKTSVPWRRALNSLLPDAVSVLEARYVSDEFHSRFSALGKVYSYTLWLEREYKLPHRRKYVYSSGPLDRAAMLAASSHFVGEHDFASYMNTGTPVKSTVREVYSFDAKEGSHPKEWIWTIRGNGFLKQMVRNIMGTMIAVGRGKITAGEVPTLILNKDRTKAPATAPAHGLCMEKVIYGDIPYLDE
ncbi:MAG: tRNA pseudouridine(38-40) synthase TruA [Desulfovibrio sp.]